jgi:hypothetical protein
MNFVQMSRSVSAVLSITAPSDQPHQERIAERKSVHFANPSQQAPVAASFSNKMARLDVFGHAAHTCKKAVLPVVGNDQR